jgi:mRNA interferase MazF
MVINQYDIYLIDLDPTIGHEMKKMRPCVVISPNEINYNIQTVIIAPMTTKSYFYPTRVEINFQEKTGWIVLDQIKTVDKNRLNRKLGVLDKVTIKTVKSVIKEMLVD